LTSLTSFPTRRSSDLFQQYPKRAKPLDGGFSIKLLQDPFDKPAGAVEVSRCHPRISNIAASSTGNQDLCPGSSGAIQKDDGKIRAGPCRKYTSGQSRGAGADKGNIYRGGY